MHGKTDISRFELHIGDTKIKLVQKSIWVVRDGGKCDTEI